MLALDLDRGESRRQGRTRHDVLGPNPAFHRVEVHRVAFADIGRSNAEPRMSRVQQIEVDELEQRRPQRFGIVEAQRAFGAPRLHPSCGKARTEKAGHPRCHAGKRTPSVEEAAQHVAIEERHGDDPVSYFLPEGAQLLGAAFRRVAGDDGTVDRSDGNAGDPVGLVAAPREGGVDTGLVGAEGAAALQHKANLGAPPGPRYFLPRQLARHFACLTATSGGSAAHG